MCSFVKILLTCASVVAGLFLLVSSILAVMEYKDTISKCFKKDDSFWIVVPDTTRSNICNPYFAMTGVLVAAFLAATIQLFGCLYSFVDRSHAGRSWRSFHATVFLLAIIGFGVGMYYFGDSNATISALEHFQGFQDQDKKTLLNAALGIDWIFCLVVIILASCLPDNRHYAYSRP